MTTQQVFEKTLVGVDISGGLVAPVSNACSLLPSDVVGIYASAMSS